MAKPGRPGPAAAAEEPEPEANGTEEGAAPVADPALQKERLGELADKLDKMKALVQTDEAVEATAAEEGDEDVLGAMEDAFKESKEAQSIRETQKQELAVRREQRIFSGLTFWLEKEVPHHTLELVIRAFDRVLTTSRPARTDGRAPDRLATHAHARSYLVDSRAD